MNEVISDQKAFQNYLDFSKGKSSVSLQTHKL